MPVYWLYWYKSTHCNAADEQVLCRELAIFVRELGKKLKDAINHEVLLQKGAFMAGSMSARQMVQAIPVEHLVYILNW